MKVECYSNDKGKGLLELCDGRVTGARISSCHPKWYKGCKKRGRCERAFSDGMYWQKQEVAEILDVSVYLLSNDIIHNTIMREEKKAFKKCRRITVTVTETNKGESND